MKLLLKQRLLSFLDSFDIYDENDEVAYRVEGRLSFGHREDVYDAEDNLVGTIQQRVLTFLPKFEIYQSDEYIGEIRKEFTFFRPQFSMDYLGWQVEGDLLGWDYQIMDANGELVAVISKELFNWTDTYSIDIIDDENTLDVLLLVLAIDAEKCSSNQ